MKYCFWLTDLEDSSFVDSESSGTEQSVKHARIPPPPTFLEGIRGFNKKDLLATQSVDGENR